MRRGLAFYRVLLIDSQITKKDALLLYPESHISNLVASQLRVLAAAVEDVQQSEENVLLNLPRREAASLGQVSYCPFPENL